MKLTPAVLLSTTLLFAVAALEAADLPPGMKSYQMVFLRKGTNTNLAKAEVARMQQEHLDGLIALNESRTNVLFGPFTDDTELRGLVVLDVPDVASAQRLLAGDPFVKNGVLTLEVKPWFSETNVFALPQKPHVPEPLVFGFLMRGTNRAPVTEETKQIQKGHLDYMGELHKQGKLIAAGPFGGDSAMRGLVIYRVPTVEDAVQLAAGDPAVKAGRLIIEAHPWMTFKGMLK